MNCDRAQRLVSRAMDGEPSADPALDLHLDTCGDCREFREAAIRVESGFRVQVRAGTERLRGGEGGGPWGKEDEPGRRRGPARKRAGFVAAAAGILGVWIAIGAARAPRTTEAGSPGPAPALAGPAAPAFRALPVRPRCLLDEFRPAEAEDGELGAVGGDPLWPVRLDQDLMPPRSLEADLGLPLGLRF